MDVIPYISAIIAFLMIAFLVIVSGILIRTSISTYKETKDKTAIVFGSVVFAGLLAILFFAVKVFIQICMSL